MQAARLLEKGYSQSEVARRVGAHRQSVSQWAAELREKGRAGLKKAGRAGRKPRLSSQQLKKIEQGLKQGPEALGYGTSLWTSARVAHLIEQECGVEYHPGPRLAHPAAVGMELSASHGARPGAGRREDPAVEAETLAGVKKKAKNEGRTIVFIDESGLSERPHRCRTWAPRGQTPVLQYHFNWKTLSAMAGVTWWNFYFRLFPGAIRSPQIIEFLSHLSAPHSRQAADRLGRAARASQPRGVGVRTAAARASVAGVSSRLRAGTEPGRVSVVALETARTAELLPARLRATERSCSPGVATHASPAYPGLRLLGAGRTLSFVTILCETQ